MSETNSLHTADALTGQSLSADSATAQTLEAAGHLFFERIGVGGMGEVYRCADDALQRDLAIKVLRAELRGDAGAEERFLREARLTGSLQHPGIVPVHHLGRLADGRPCYTMKLVRGRTLAELLRDEAAGPERLPRLLAVIEKMCQAVAFAHSKGIIHRDLKPSNVMVGEFGEVQVMDWGLAKQLSRPEPAPPAEATAEVETLGRVEEAAGLSRAGAALGTPAYMPPEQAAGDWDIVDERADVFALGAILCELLTGRPPYHGSNRDDLLRRARRGDVAEALGRLEQCGADVALVDLCRECLAAECWQRPRHAGVVAERLAAYQAQVQERLRRAEVERAETEVRVREERKRRRLTLALALLVLLLVTGGGAAWSWRQQQLDKAERAVSNTLVQVDLLAGQARENPLQTDKYQQALEAARVAGQLAESASAEAHQKVKERIAQLEQEEAAARKDRDLLAALLDVRDPREGPKYRSDATGTMMALVEPTVDEQFAAAFRRWGLDVDTTPPSEAAAILKARPAVVVTGVIAALDQWTLVRRVQQQGKTDANRLAELAALLDDNPSSKRRELRAILARRRLQMEHALGVLSAALRPVPIPFVVPLGADHLRLRQLAAETDPTSEPILGILTLHMVLIAAGEEAQAERLLRAAIVARPQEVVLHNSLGELLTAHKPPRWAEAVESFGAARTLRPDLGVNLAMALLKIGRDEEGLALLARLVSEMPKNPYLHFQLAHARNDKGQLDEAAAEYRKALALDPKFAAAHVNLGKALHDTGDLDGAIARYQKALELDPKDARHYSHLGIALREKGDPDSAIAYSKKALDLDPKLAQAHTNLGVALKDKGNLDGSIACYHKALALDPEYAPAHNCLGALLCDYKHDPAGAIVCFRKAIDLNPKDAKVHFNLGTALRNKGDPDGAIACYQKALDLDPKLTRVHHGLGLALRDKGQLDDAVAEYQKEIALGPKNAAAHYDLGNALGDKGQLDEAVAEYRQAIALNPKDAGAHFALGRALVAKGQLDEAAAEYRQAIRLKPDAAEAHCNLGGVLQKQGRFDEALAFSRRGHELGSKQPGWRYPSAQWVKAAEQLLTLDKKLPAILSGEEAPINPGEAVALASMCQQPYKKRYAASARLYADAFTTEPKFAADLNRQNRFNAACSAALAAAGQGEDARLLSDKVAAMFRRWALGWLREDLQTYARLAQQNNPQLNQAIQQRLTHWRSDPDLASVRDPQALDRLPEYERTAWQALWREVDELLARVAKSNGQKATQKQSQPNSK